MWKFFIKESGVSPSFFSFHLLYSLATKKQNNYPGVEEQIIQHVLSEVSVFDFLCNPLNDALIL